MDTLYDNDDGGGGRERFLRVLNDYRDHANQRARTRPSSARVWWINHGSKVLWAVTAAVVLLLALFFSPPTTKSSAMPPPTKSSPAPILASNNLTLYQRKSPLMWTTKAAEALNTLPGIAASLQRLALDMGAARVPALADSSSNSFLSKHAGDDALEALRATCFFLNASASRVDHAAKFGAASMAQCRSGLRNSATAAQRWTEDGVGLEALERLQTETMQAVSTLQSARTGIGLHTELELQTALKKLSLLQAVYMDIVRAQGPASLTGLRYAQSFFRTVTAPDDELQPIRKLVADIHLPIKQLRSVVADLREYVGYLGEREVQFRQCNGDALAAELRTLHAGGKADELAERIKMAYQELLDFLDQYRLDAE